MFVPFGGFLAAVAFIVSGFGVLVGCKGGGRKGGCKDKGDISTARAVVKETFMSAGGNLYGWYGSR